jgi:hypothetical protein
MWTVTRRCAMAMAMARWAIVQHVVAVLLNLM